MKVRVYVERVVEIEIDNPRIEELTEFHRADSHNVASDEEYQFAVEYIEKATGIPVLSPFTPLTSDHINGVYTEDDVVVFET